ncbi:hypothetical protein pb186bvf_002236 [Paramecium bursaria]
MSPGQSYLGQVNSNDEQIGLACENIYHLKNNKQNRSFQFSFKMSKQVICFQPEEYNMSFVNTNQYLLTKHSQNTYEEKNWTPGSLLSELFQMVDNQKYIDKYLNKM